MIIPFDISKRPQIESGEYKVITNDGHNVRIICWDKRTGGEDCIVALVSGEQGGEKTLHYTKEGYCTSSTDEFRKRDLFIITPEEELTDFEQEVSDIVDYCKEHGKNVADGYAKRHAKSLLSLAREQFIKDGYVIEKKAFHDAVEKIDDKHKAEMSIQYSLHCKIEDRTRHAVMNWQEFQELAQKFINIGKDEALKDLPRWKKIGQGNNYRPETEFCINGRYLEMNDNWNSLYEISLKSLEKLPKEDEE